MKKIKLNTAKLQLKKETISSLTTEEMYKLQGGNKETLNLAACMPYNPPPVPASGLCPGPAPTNNCTVGANLGCTANIGITTPNYTKINGC